MNLWNLGIFWKTPKNSVCPNNPAALPIKAKNALSNSKLLVYAGAAAGACCLILIFREVSKFFTEIFFHSQILAIFLKQLRKNTMNEYL